MVINRPKLPPKAGYVEVIDSNGNHVYQPTPETRRRLEEEEVLKQSANADSVYDEIAVAYQEGVNQA